VRAWRRFSIGALFVGTVLFLAGCGSGSGTTPSPNQAVAITEQPLSQTVPIGQTATFTVTATGTAPLSYQWSENGAEISGATSASYTTPAVELGNNGSTQNSALIGSFQVTVGNASGFATSKSATLTAGPRSPKAGDLRYLLFQQVDVPGLLDTGGLTSDIEFTPGSATSAWGSPAVGTPLGIGSTYLCVDSGPGTCVWPFDYYFLPPPMTGLAMYYQPGEYSSFTSDLQSYAAPNVVFTSLDLEPADNAYAVSWVKTTQTGGFDYRIDPMVPAGTDQPALIQAQAVLDGSESRVITAVSFDASGNAVLISYGWTGDTTTLYEDQTYFVAAGSGSGVSANVLAAATNLANNGYVISAFGGNDIDGYILIGMRVKGDSLPRQLGNYPDQPPYATTVVYLNEIGANNAEVTTFVNEQ